ESIRICQRKKIAVPEDLFSQLSCFQLRKGFRHANFENLFSDKHLLSSQAHYYQIWARFLPFHAFYHSQRDDYLSFFGADTTQLYLKQFRFRTLLGRLHPDDFKNPRLSEIVDRIYLWTWRWLIDSD